MASIKLFQKTDYQRHKSQMYPKAKQMKQTTKWPKYGPASRRLVNGWIVEECQLLMNGADDSASSTDLGLQNFYRILVLKQLTLTYGNW